MNDVFFACRNCKSYIDAGYRWPVSTLFSNHWGKFPLKLDVQGVLSHGEYWGGEALHPYLAEVLPAARRFLLSHETHDLVFGDFESFMNFDDPGHRYLEWLNAASLSDPKRETVYLEPRYFVEHPDLGYRLWEQVEEYCGKYSCGWTGDEDATAAAREVFLKAVEAIDRGET